MQAATGGLPLWFDVVWSFRNRLPARGSMKGPFQRLKWDLRRGWECPICQRRERTAGTATFRHCLCQMQKLDGKPVVMKLIEDEPPHLRPMLPAPRCQVAANASDPSLLSPAEAASPSESSSDAPQ